MDCVAVAHCVVEAEREGDRELVAEEDISAELETLSEGLAVPDKHWVGVGEEEREEDCVMDSVAVSHCDAETEAEPH